MQQGRLNTVKFFLRAFQRSQWGHRGIRTGKGMKLAWVWFHASLGEEAAACSNRELWNISLPQKYPNPRLESWAFTLPPAPTSQPSTDLVSIAPALGPPKISQRGPLEKAKARKARETQSQIMPRCPAPALSSPASHQESQEGKRPFW